MLGAIIGDLATWIWEHDRECFYRQLVSKLSGYGLLALSIWKPIIEEDSIVKHWLYMKIGKALIYCPPCAEISHEWRDWWSSDYG